MSTDLSAGPAMSPALASLLDNAWPGLVHDPERGAAYAKALGGLDPAVVEATVASLRATGGEAPAPGVLRTLVMARVRAGTSARAGVERPPAEAAAPAVDEVSPEAGRRRLALPAAICAALGLVTLFSLTLPWLTLSVEGMGSDSLSGWDVDHAKLVIVFALVCALMGGVAAAAAWVGSVSAAKVAVGIAGAAAIGAVYRTFRWWSEADEGARTIKAVVTQVQDVDLATQISVGVGAGAWVSIASALLAVGAAQVAIWRLQRAGAD